MDMGIHVSDTPSTPGFHAPGAMRMNWGDEKPGIFHFSPIDNTSGCELTKQDGDVKSVSQPVLG